MRIFVTGGSGFIGTHVIAEILDRFPGARILNVDLEKPKLAEHVSYWRQGDLMEWSSFAGEVIQFCPTHAIHMAARTDSDGVTLDDYKLNIIGCEHFMKAIKAANSVKRTIYYSTQYVVRAGKLPAQDREYRPVNLYGESKSRMEELIRSDVNHPGIWTIVRPTNIWGPWHPRYAKEFWLVVKKGHYMHPGGAPVMRAYGYVGNVAAYTLRIFDAPDEIVSGKTFYLGDPADDIRKWVTAFSLSLTGSKPISVPRFILRALALAGDAVRAAGMPFPLFTSRYKSMTQDYLVDMAPTISALGVGKYSLEEGVEETVKWLKSLGGIWLD